MTTKVTDIATAEEILRQLGGRRFALMVGAKNFMSIENGLQFALPNRFAKDGINKVRVVLDGDDTYTVTFWRTQSKAPYVFPVAACPGVYNEELQSVFKEQTGLDTKLSIR